MRSLLLLLLVAASHDLMTQFDFEFHALAIESNQQQQHTWMEREIVGGKSLGNSIWIERLHAKVQAATKQKSNRVLMTMTHI